MSKWISALMGIGLLFLFVARQVIEEGGAALSVTWLGAAMVVGAVGWRVYERSQAVDKSRPIEMAILWSYIGVLLSLVLFALSTDWGLGVLGAEGEDSKINGIVSVLWPSLFVVSTFALIFMELAYARMPVQESVEERRVRSAAFDGLSIALSFVFVVSINFVAAKRDIRKDVSYFQTTRPSDSTKNMVKALGTDVKVILFYPEVNDVLSQLRPYFELVTDASKRLKFEVKDHALVPSLARKHRIRGNGHVVLVKGERAESFKVGTGLEEARKELKTLDGQFQQAFTKLTRQKRELHLTVGHRERSRSGEEGDQRGQHMSELYDAFGRSNITTRDLGVAQGLAQNVPNGAPAVGVFGPREPFLEEEARSLLRYVEAGGRLVVLLDPNVEHGLEPLLKGLGLRIKDGVLCSDRQFRRRYFNDSDKALIYTSVYSSHPTVTVASRNQGRVATIFVEGGALEKYEGDGVLKGAKTVFPIRTNALFYLDRNGDYNRSDEEKLEQYDMMAAVTVPKKGGGSAEDEGRAVVIADGDFVTDQVIRNPGNSLVFGDILNWLLGQEEIIGAPASEEDVRIEHSREEDKLQFWATSFGIPLPFFALGAWMVFRKRRRTSVTGDGEPDSASEGMASEDVVSAGSDAKNGQSDKGAES